MRHEMRALSPREVDFGAGEIMPLMGSTRSFTPRFSTQGISPSCTALIAIQIRTAARSSSLLHEHAAHQVRVSLPE